ncbi:MAG: HD domain-containing protein [Acidobacteria bacterium]|uniref:HD domain-containing protein n=1 Tax=Candidatus Polarisedimenticola svalbardensis TaxID=2886004 RepID=A0A8J6XWJ3_9BACT|nr:HD domain-containing protein [Candidatus Polarisedimenticola svalbardensis]
MANLHEAAGKETSDRRPNRRRGHIAYALTAVLCLVGLVPLASVAFKLIHINREALTTAQQENQLLLASSTAQEVGIYISGLKSRVRNVSLNLSHLQPGTQRFPVSRGRTVLSEAESGGVLYLRFTDLRGNVIGSRPESSFPQGLESLFTAGMGEVAGLLEASDDPAGRVWLSEPYLLDVDGPAPAAMILLAAPVVAEGKFRGVVSALVDFQEFWETIMASKRTGQTLFILDGSGTPFVSSNLRDVMPGNNMSDSELVQHFMLGARRLRATTPFEREADGVVEEYLGSYEISAQGWGVFVQARMEQVYLPVRTMIESTVTWVLWALGLAIVTALIFARKVVAGPINTLAAVSRAFAKGDFNARAVVKANNEIGELADTFNFMADEIESQISRLKLAAEENNELFLSTIRVMANAIDAKDPYTRGHSVRVNKYSVIIARYMGLEKKEIDAIHVASVLHDVGKIGIHDAILNKPGALTPEEYDVMKTHTTRGAEIMAPIRKLKNIIDGLRSHHERWNGSGYPDGLKGEDIPLMGRIIAVADTFDAMTTNRPYQRSLSFQQAVDRINDIKASAFDDRVVESFNRAYQAGEFGTKATEHGPDVSAVAS